MKRGITDWNRLSQVQDVIGMGGRQASQAAAVSIIAMKVIRHLCHLIHGGSCLSGAGPSFDTTAPIPHLHRSSF